MKRVFAGTCLAVAFAVGLSAQYGSQSTPSQSSKDKDAKTTTVTGCLRAGDQPDTYVLSNVKWEEKGAKSTTGTTGAPPSTTGAGAPAASSDKPTTLKLVDAPSSIKLSEHVGHTIQVTGSIAPSSMAGGAGTGAGATGTTGERSRAGESAKPQQSLSVRSVTMVSESCNPM